MTDLRAMHEAVAGMPDAALARLRADLDAAFRRPGAAAHDDEIPDPAAARWPVSQTTGD